MERKRYSDHTTHEVFLLGGPKDGEVVSTPANATEIVVRSERYSADVGTYRIAFVSGRKRGLWDGYMTPARRISATEVISQKTLLNANPVVLHVIVRTFVDDLLKKILAEGARVETVRSIVERQSGGLNVQASGFVLSPDLIGRDYYPITLTPKEGKR